MMVTLKYARRVEDERDHWKLVAGALARRLAHRMSEPEYAEPVGLLRAMAEQESDGVYADALELLERDLQTRREERGNHEARRDAQAADGAVRDDGP